MQPINPGPGIAVSRRVTCLPRDLFHGGASGAWFDPSDPETLFRDAAGTTQVSADDDPVGRVMDESGNGYHATQATSPHRPVYRTDGTLHWLQFDWVDHHFVLPPVFEPAVGSTWNRHICLDKGPGAAQNARFVFVGHKRWRQ